MTNKEKNNRRKGFVRNTAINVAQDIVNAGNPLNPGGHLLGSIADGILMEAGDRKMAKSTYDSIANQKTAFDMLDEMYLEKEASSRKARQDKMNYNEWVNKQNAKQRPKKKSGVVGPKNQQVLLPEVSRRQTLKDKSDLAREYVQNPYKKSPFKTDKAMGMVPVSVNKQKSKAGQKISEKVVDIASDSPLADVSKTKGTKIGKYLLMAGVPVAGAGIGLAARDIYKKHKQSEKTAFDMLDEMYMEKTAAMSGVVFTPIADKISTKIGNIGAGARMLKNPDSRKVITGALTGSRSRALKKEIRDLQAQRDNLNIAQKITGKKKKLDRQYKLKLQDLEHEQDLSKTVRGAAAKTGLVAGGTGLAAKTMYDQNKQASDLLDNMYMEKTAGIETILANVGSKLSTLPKTLPKAGARYKELLTGSNVKNLENATATAKQNFFDAGKQYDKVRKANLGGGTNSPVANNFTDRANKQMYNNMMNNKNLYQAAKSDLAAEQNKVLATRVGTGVGAGLVAKNIYDQNKQASDLLDNMFMEKTAGLKKN